MKIAVCTPHHGLVHSDYAYSVSKMLMHTVQSRINFNGQPTTPEIELFMQSSSTLPTLRNELINDALQWGANYLLLVDSDHNFPPEALLRLLSLNLPIVGANYPRRTHPTYPTVVNLEGTSLIWTTEEVAREGKVEQVSSIGLGFCLIDCTVFEKLHQHAQANGRTSFWPLFAFEPVPNQIRNLGEDVFFFRRVSEAGIAIYVDHALSWYVGHVRAGLVTHHDALLEREAFDEKQRALEMERADTAVR